jgi:hypothetical protein
MQHWSSAAGPCLALIENTCVEHYFNHQANPWLLLVFEETFLILTEIAHVVQNMGKHSSRQDHIQGQREPASVKDLLQLQAVVPAQ